MLKNAKEQIKIRLEGIDAPELKQVYGTAAKKALSDLVFGKTVTVQDRGKDRYGRTLADVFVDGLWVNLAMIEKGFAWHFRKYSKDPRLRAAEVKAHEERVGLREDSNAAAPWNWAKKQKTALMSMIG